MQGRLWVGLIVLAGSLLAGQDPAENEQAAMITAMRNYAADYTDSLPNFICQEVVSQYESGRKPNHWKQGDTLRSKLVFNNGKEERTLLAVNNKDVVGYHRQWRRPLTTAGEFGVWLSNIFNPKTEAQFSWGGWQELDGKRLAKFNYKVDQGHSTLSLTLSDLAKAVVPYHGTVWGDPQTGDVFRIWTEADDIPAAVRTRSTATTIDYGQVAIGGKTYLLPVKAEVLMATDTNHIRNVMQFENYRKFEAESTITFGDGAQH